MRVGGFIISHAGMMSVVLTLTEMFTGAGSIVVLIIGNLFVMGLEGFIVGIPVAASRVLRDVQPLLRGPGHTLRPGKNGFAGPPATDPRP